MAEPMKLTKKARRIFMENIQKQYQHAIEEAVEEPKEPEEKDK